jgi:hypothetical protein
MNFVTSTKLTIKSKLHQGKLGWWQLGAKNGETVYQYKKAE